jgi:hypothetical protein
MSKNWLTHSDLTEMLHTKSVIAAQLSDEHNLLKIGGCTNIFLNPFEGKILINCPYVRYPSQDEGARTQSCIQGPSRLHSGSGKKACVVFST